jgi:hypothetical protein
LDWYEGLEDIPLVNEFGFPTGHFLGATQYWPNAGGICGDVNCSGGEPDMSDVLLLWYYVGYPGQYELCSGWAGDVNCSGGEPDMSDVLLLWYYVGYPGQYELNCCYH